MQNARNPSKSRITSIGDVVSSPGRLPNCVIFDCQSDERLEPIVDESSCLTQDSHRSDQHLPGKTASDPHDTVPMAKIERSSMLANSATFCSQFHSEMFARFSLIVAQILFISCLSSKTFDP
jgi:hypothetical protein